MKQTPPSPGCRDMTMALVASVAGGGAIKQKQGGGEKSGGWCTQEVEYTRACGIPKHISKRHSTHTQPANASPCHPIIHQPSISIHHATRKQHIVRTRITPISSTPVCFAANPIILTLMRLILILIG